MANLRKTWEHELLQGFQNHQNAMVDHLATIFTLVCGRKDAEISALQRELRAEKEKRRQDISNLKEEICSLTFEVEQIKLAKNRQSPETKEDNKSVNSQNREILKCEPLTVQQTKNGQSSENKGDNKTLNTGVNKTVTPQNRGIFEGEPVTVQETKKTAVSPVKKTNIICRFYQSHKCDKGDSCIYNHTSLCFFYNNSTCKNGNSCEYLHEKITCKYDSLCSIKFCPFMHNVRRKKKAKKLKTEGLLSQLGSSKTIATQVSHGNSATQVTLKALALYDKEAEDSDELSFKINDELIVLKENWQNG